MNTIQRYELIRPILKQEKTTKQVSQEENVPLSNIYRYLKRFREGCEDMESLADKSHANHSHPGWLTSEDRDKVTKYKHQHPHLSSRQIAEALAQEGVVKIRYRAVANILKERGLTTPFLSTDHLS